MSHEVQRSLFDSHGGGWAMAAERLLRSLRQTKRRVRAVVIASGAVWALLAALALLLALVWLDLLLDLPPAMRGSAGTAALVLAALLVFRAARLSVRRSAWARLAYRLDEVGGSRGQIASGVDLALDLRPRPLLTIGLLHLAVGRAVRLVERVAPSAAVPARPVWWAAGSFAVVCAVMGILAGLAPRLARTQWLRFTDPYGDHPAYSRITFGVAPGDFEVLYGRGHDIRVTPEGGPVEKVELVMRWGAAGGEETLHMFPEADGRWSASIGNITRPGEYYVRAHSARSHHFKIKVITVPRIEEVRFRIIPPAYTRRGVYEGPLPPEGLTGLPGTRVEGRVQSNRPLSRGVAELTMAGGPPVRLEWAPASEDPRIAVGSFEIREPGKLQLSVVDQDGQPSNDTFAASITVLADQRPFVRLLEPPVMSFATPDVDVPVALIGEDDYGVLRLELYRSLNESRALPVDMAVPAPPPARHQATTALPLARYGLRPGDVLTFYARVEDNDPAGAKGSESPIVTLHIISPADLQRMMLQRQGMEVLQSKYEQARRRLETVAEDIAALQKELEGLPADSELAEEKRRELERLTKKAQAEAQEIRKAAQEKLPFDLDEALSKELAKLAKGLEDAASEMGELAATSGLSTSDAGEALEQIRKKLAGQREEFETEAMEPLEHLARILPLLEDESRFIQVYQAQRDLEQRLASLKDRRGEDNPELKARMRDLEAEQRQIREELARLLDDIESHAAALPDDPRLEGLREMATEFAEAVRGSGAAEAMAEAEDALAQFSGARAHPEAKEAADILEEFIARCKAMGKGGMAGQCLKFQPTLVSSLGNTVEQLLAEAGLGLNTGSGLMGAAGSGYSAWRNTLSNVGLYGTIPAIAMLEMSGRGQGDTKGVLGRGQPGDQEADTAMVDPAAALKAVGAGAASVPISYRQRVGDYFERISDELGTK